MSRAPSERVTLFPEVEPWDQPVEGAELLEDVAAHLRRYIVLPDHAAETISAWVVATWLAECVHMAPLLAISSPTKRAGKTVLLELLRPVVCRGFLTSGVGVTAAVIFRLNEQEHPTLLIDEAEKLAGDDQARELIGLLNAGHRRGGRVLRCAERTHAVQAFDAFGFRAVAVIGHLWDTLADRAIEIPMSRKPPGATVERFRAQRAEEEGAELARRIVRWVHDHREAVVMALDITPRPDWLHDRACDNWSSLFAVGMAATGGWIHRLKAAARALSGAVDRDEGDRRELILQDIRTVFEDAGVEELASTALVEALNRRDESPWGDLAGGRGLTTIKLAALLRPFKIVPDKWRVGAQTLRGYRLAAFDATFASYLSSPQVGVDTPPQLDDKHGHAESPQPESPQQLDTADNAALSNGSAGVCRRGGLNRGDEETPGLLCDEVLPGSVDYGPD